MWEVSCSRVSVYFLAWKHFVCSILFVRREYIGLMKLGDHGLDSKRNLAQPRTPQPDVIQRERGHSSGNPMTTSTREQLWEGGPQGRGVHMERVSTWTKATATSSLLSCEGPPHAPEVFPSVSSGLCCPSCPGQWHCCVKRPLPPVPSDLGAGTDPWWRLDCSSPADCCCKRMRPQSRDRGQGWPGGRSCCHEPAWT